MHLAFSITAAVLVFWFGFGASFDSPKLIACVTVIAGCAVRSRFRSPVEPVWLLLFLFPLCSILWAADPRPWLLATASLLAAIAAWSLRPLSEPGRALLARAIALTGMVTTVYLIAQVLDLDLFTYPEGTRPGSFWGNPNYCGHVLVLCLCLGRLPGRLCWLPTALALVGIALTGSKGAIGAAFVWTIFTATRQVRNALLIGALLVLIGLGWYARHDWVEGARWITRPADWSEAHAEQPLTIAERDPWFKGKRASLVTRVILWGNSTAVLADHAILGAGSGGFRAAYPRHAASWVGDPNVNQIYRPSAAHNWPLDAAIAFGLPWLALFLIGLVHHYRRTRSDTRWWLAFALQAGIGLFSSNYLVPAIPIALILTAPTRSDPIPARPARWIVPLWFAVIASVVWSDYRAATRAGVLFPENRARLAYANGDLEEAWQAQLAAWERDPFGPEILFNLGLMAEARDETEIAIEAYALVAAACPHYRPAHRRLNALIEDPAQRIVRNRADLDGARRGLRDRIARDTQNR